MDLSDSSLKALYASYKVQFPTTVSPATLSQAYQVTYRVASQAANADKRAEYRLAVTLYQLGITLAERIQPVEPVKAKREVLVRKLGEYCTRRDQLGAYLPIWLQTHRLTSEEPKNKPMVVEPLAHQGRDLTRQAEKAEQLDDKTQAVALYCEAADSFLRAYKQATAEQKPTLKTAFDRAVERAGELKAITANHPIKKLTESVVTHAAVLPPSPSPRISVELAVSLGRKLEPINVAANPLPGNQSTRALSPEEFTVLRTTSYVHGMLFLPWDDRDATEQFVFDQPFVDKDGLLALSTKQTKAFGSWQRPRSFMTTSRMVADQISCYDIIQDVVTDCSFVASLCIAANYEARFRKPLITSCIYPQDALGRPVYNPSGKYIVRLTYNGIPRRITVDDLFPLSKDGRPMFTYTRTRSELWPSIIEKAYMKLMGGYDFPGSNSSIDLYTLTGWIPEQIFIQDGKFKDQAQWERIHKGLIYGDVLVTVATGEMEPEEAERLGLVPSHAYALLRTEVVANGTRLLQLKNPWSVKRWKGPYSHLDTVRWTPSLCQQLGYSPQLAGEQDNGIFWIDYDSICRIFHSIHLSWNPELFTSRQVVHRCWPVSVGPRSVISNLGENPQYQLTVANQPSTAEVPPDHAPVWLLLTKHITVKEENRDYLSVYLYDKTSGKRVHSPENPVEKTDFINSPHLLVRFNARPGLSHFTIVLLQYEKCRDMHYTLRVFSMAPIVLAPVAEYPYRKQLRQRWTLDNAGGSQVYPTFYTNPQYKLVIHQSDSTRRASGMLVVEAPAGLTVQAVVVYGGCRVSHCNFRNLVAQSGAYSEHACYCPLEDLLAGEYTVVISTHEPGQTGTYLMTMELDFPFDLTPIAAEGAGMFKRVLKGQWISGISAMGTSDHGAFFHNPKYLVQCSKTTTLAVRLQTLDIQPLPAINVVLMENSQSSASLSLLGREVASSGAYTNLPQGTYLSPVNLTPLSTGYVLVVSTWEPNIEGRFQLFVYSDQRMDITPL
ncbi:cysteine protease [Dispira simplex]|nr:cysteine protease [Dispira simplex]